MTDPVHVDPVPTLSYYTEVQSVALRTLARLVLLAGAANGLLTVVYSAADFIENWPPWSSRVVAEAISALQLGTSLTIAFLCLAVRKTGRGRIITIIAIGIAMVLDACNYLQNILQSPDTSPVQIAQNIAYFLQDCLIPLLVVVILMRSDMRPAPMSSRS